MALTEKQIQDLNNMNVAAQRAGLGNLLKGSETPGEVSEATTEKAGIVKQAKAQADSSATGSDVDTLKTDFNSLLAKLREAGILAGE